MLRDWRRQVQEELLPDLHGHQSKALADLSFAMTVAAHCHSGKLAVAAPGDARPASAERRVERLLANDRLDPDSAWPQLARAVLRGWAGGPIVLILDETPNHNDLRCMKITLAYRKRALPLVLRLLRPGRAARADARADRRPVPPGGRLPARGGRGHAPGRPRAGLAAGRRRLPRAGLALRDPAPGPDPGADRRRPGVLGGGPGPAPGGAWWGEAEVFKKSGWRAAAVAACWEREPRRAVAAGQRPRPTARGCSAATPSGSGPRSCSATRSRRGSTGSESHVTDPAHAARLVLLMALATYLALALGSRVIQAGLRRFLESTRQRMLSLFRIGLRWVMFCLTHDRPLPQNLSPVPS